MGDRQHADFPSEEISSRSDFTLLSWGEEPCPFSPHRGFLIPHPSPFSIQYIFKFITVLGMVPPMLLLAITEMEMLYLLIGISALSLIGDGSQNSNH
jgi:hypothetical protein